MVNEAARPSQTIEDYLQAILTMHRENEPVILARIKERLGVSAPTALAALRRMQRDGLLNVEKHHVELTERGFAEAQSIIRRHMLAERLLIDVLKIDWADAHEEAHRMEHAISPIIERHLLALLGQPTTCPHGNPIPGMEAIARDTRPLSDVAGGERVVIANISEHAEEDHELMRYLFREGLVPNVRLSVAEGASSKGTMTVAIGQDGHHLTLGIPAARVIQVQAAA